MNYQYDLELVTIKYHCNKANIEKCEFGKLYHEKGRPCRHMEDDKYCNNIFVHCMSNDDYTVEWEKRLMADDMDMIDTHEQDIAITQAY